MRIAFSEPAWNNPVVRIIEPDHSLVVPRIVNDWTLPTLAAGMVAALVKKKQRVPDFLRLLERESVGARDGVETAIFGMT